MEERRVQAITLSKQVFVRLNIERVLFNEVLLMRPELRQPAEITNRIEQLVNIKRLK